MEDWFQEPPMDTKICGYSVQFSCSSCPTPCDPMDYSTPGFPVHHQFLKLAQTHVHYVGQWCHPTTSSSVFLFCYCRQSFPASRSFLIGQFFASDGQWMYWSFSFNISPSNEYSGLISFRMDWLDLLAVQGTLKFLLQHHSSKASILQHSSAFFMIQLSHPYKTTGKTLALTRWTFVCKVMSLFLICCLVWS